MGKEEVVHAGIGSKVLINGNVYKIVYTRQTPVFRFTAEFVKKHEPAKNT